MNGDLEHGDPARYVPTGEAWTVDHVVPVTAYQPQRVVLFRAESDGEAIRVGILECSPKQVQVVCKVADRTIFPGCDLSDDIRRTLSKPRYERQEMETPVTGLQA